MLSLSSLYTPSLPPSLSLSLHRPPLFPSTDSVPEEQWSVSNFATFISLSLFSLPPPPSLSLSVDSGGDGGTVEEEPSNASQVVMEEEISEGWDRTVHTHLMALAASPVETLWPKDNLFRSPPHRTSHWPHIIIPHTAHRTLHIHTYCTEAHGGIRIHLRTPIVSPK